MSVAKIALLAALATLATVALYQTQIKTQQISNEDHLLAEFKAWKIEHNKPYGGAEEAQRFTIYKSNKAAIELHEASTPNRTYTVGINKFADLTTEEFAAIYLGFQPGQVSDDNVVSTISANPESVDWREENIVGEIKDQAQCGSCWAFSAIAALEGLQAQTTGKQIRLSEQELVDCSRFDNGCHGGQMIEALIFAAHRGIESEEDYGYTGVDGNCKYQASKVVFQNKGAKQVVKNNWEALETAVAKQVVSVAVGAGNTAFHYYTGGVINTEECHPWLDHGIAIVGYTADAWIIRNSWGTQWGENGYGRIAKGDQLEGAGICGINKQASYPTA